MHRHLFGLNSPAVNFVADPLTLGPVLPEGWDGDAWVAADGIGYFLRAWHIVDGRVAYGEGQTYAGARKALLNDVVHGRKRVEVRQVAS